MTVFSRKTPRNRKFVDINAAAATIIGQLEPETEIYGITKGDISLIDIIAHVMNDTNSRDVLLATWTAAAGSLQTFSDMLSAKAIRSIRMIVDPSFITRKPADCDLVFRLFGPDAIRCAPSHAKYAVLTGGRLPATIRTSMNLNPNRRIETFEISIDPAMADYHLSLADSVFAELAVPLPGQTLSQSRRVLDVVGNASPKRLF